MIERPHRFPGGLFYLTLILYKWFSANNSLNKKANFAFFKLIVLGRYLAVDYGTKRCGIAVTDPMRMIASPLTTVPSHTLMDFLSGYFEKETVERVVFGLPRKMNNQESESLSYIRDFVKRFSSKFPQIKVDWMDERFTSGMAVKVMVDGGMKKKDRQVKGNIDMISAAIILQSYLEQEANEAGRKGLE